ncbi:MAG: DMT family transporter [Lachnospiraceae bacterium]|nr:DMT family transporter [Lachnospiraceae bacterium]
MSQNSVTKRKAVISAIVCYFFWGMSFMASRTALGIAAVFTVLSHRFVLAFLVMTVLCFTPLGDCHLKGKPLLPLILLGLFQPVIYFFGEQYGILHSSTIFSGVMIALIPIVSSLAAIPVLGEKPSVRQFVFSIFSVGGVIGIGMLTKNSGSLDWIGVVGLVVAVCSAAAYLLLGRNIAPRFTPFERAYSMICVGALAFTIPALVSVRGNIREYFIPLKNPEYILPILFLGVCCSVISFFLSNYTLTGLSVAQTSIFANFTTAISVFAGAVFLHEPFSLLGLLFCVIILLGIYGVVNAPGAKESGSEKTDTRVS